jgi:hypothetical protein
MLNAALASLALCLIVGQASAHGDEDHSKDAKPAAKSIVPGTIDATQAQRHADGSLFVPKSLQRQLGIRTTLASAGEHSASVELNGRVIADPNSGGRVQASQGGRIEPGPKGLPTLGQKVLKGQTLAFLRPNADSIERGNQQAALADLEAQLAIAEGKARRYAQLEGAIPQKEIDAVAFELAGLKKRRAAVGSSLGSAEALVAPVSGFISATAVVNGQVVEAREILFEIVDPAHLAVEALAYDPALVAGIAKASAAVPGGSLDLQFVGAGRQLREQALPLLFRVKAQNVPLAVGQPLKVIAATARTIKAVAIPLSSLTRNGAGEPVVWIHVAAERFVARKVTALPLDANSLAVSTGIANGERVVSVGAGLLSQVR